MPKVYFSNFFPFRKFNFSQKGFTLTEILVGSVIFAIVSVGILTTITLFIRYSQTAKEKVQGQNIAHQKIEEIRNMPYDDVATVAGAIYPPGGLPDLETLIVDGQTFRVYTVISYVDDPFDGDAFGTIVGKPQDFYPYDYKKITITVRDRNDNYIAETNTTMSAKAAETASNTGILSLRVQNSQGLPVQGASVNVTNTTAVPPVNVNTFTDLNGLVLIPSLPPSTNNDYNVSVALSGYNNDSTNPAFAPNNLNPVKPNFNILVQQITSITLEIDTLGNFQVNVADTNGTPVGSLNLTVTSDKLTYTSPDTYKFSQTLSTNGSGQITINNIEWDSYSIVVPSGYYIVSTSPYQKVSVNAGQSVTANLVVTTNVTYPRIQQVSPVSGVNNSTVDFVINGANLVSGSSVVLKQSGQSDIVATGVVSANGDTELSGTFNLTGVVTGSWDLVLTDPSSRVVTQTGGFQISSP